MYLIVGLGNPEEDYSKTRHNMGFEVINKISKQYNILVNKSKFNSLYGTGVIEGEKVILVKPQTFMNLSGEAVIEFVKFYKIDLSKLIIIYDDIDTNPGIIRVRKMGGPGTHNGMKSVVNILKTNDFPRVRVGIGMPERKSDLINYVIGHINEEEYEELLKGVDKAERTVIEVLKSGIDIAMNKYNNT
ncbi:MAG: aminoacyl-tRNA hydrolase [Clostridia bacterium]|nr:aminoacyl-tRNA hydrolase [Clostridia bacterium]